METSWPLADCENVLTGIEENRAREGKSCKLVTKVMAMAIVRPRGRGEKNLETASLQLLLSEYVIHTTNKYYCNATGPQCAV